MRLRTGLILAGLCYLLPRCVTYHVTLGGFSRHFEPTYHGKAYNESHNNVGVGFEYTRDRTNVGFTTQYVKNSFGNDSIYTTAFLSGTNLKTENFKNSTGVAIGFATGYGDRYGVKSTNPIPILGLINEICYTNFCLYQLLMPPYDGMAGVGVIGGKVNFNFGKPD